MLHGGHKKEAGSRDGWFRATNASGGKSVHASWLAMRVSRLHFCAGQRSGVMVTHCPWIGDFGPPLLRCIV